MKRVYFDDGVFVIDGKKRFLFSGEIHYFRLTKDDLEDRLRKIKEAGFDTVSLYVPWFWHEIEDGIFDFDGRSDERRDLSGFLKLVDSYGFDVIFKPGPYIMSELKNEGLPGWIYEKVPNAIAKTIDGKIHPTRVFSYLHQDFLKYVKRWYENVLSVVKNHNVILVQIDNEVGMLQWITGHGDYNEDTIIRFKEFLKRTDMECYEELRSWSYGKSFSKRLLKRYHEFSREYYAEYLQTLANYVKESGIDVPVIVNIHGFDMVEYAKRGKNYPIGVSQLMNASKIENAILSGDYYIGNVVHENFSDLAIANAIMYAVQNRNQPLFSAEFQSGFQMDRPKLLPSTLDLTSRLCVGQGMNGINYYMFVGGENPEDAGLMGKYHDWQAPIGKNGELRKSYYVLKNLITEIREIEEELLCSKPVFETFFGFIPSYYSTEYFSEHGFSISDLSFKRNISIFDGVIRGLKLLNYSFGGVNLEQDGDLDPKIFNSLWVFSYIFMPRDVQIKLTRYVKDGGKLVLFPEIPLYDEFGDECLELYKMLEISKVDKYGWKFAHLFDTEVNAYHIDGYELCGEYEPFGWDNDGNVCAFKKNFSNGLIFMLGCGVELEREYKLKVIESICKAVGIRKTLDLISEDGFVDGYIRRSDREDIVFLNNYDDYDKKVEIIIDGVKCTTVNLQSRSGKILRFKLTDSGFRSPVSDKLIRVKGE